MQTTIYLFLNKNNEVIYVGKTENHVSQRIGSHHKGKMVFYETAQIIYSEWNYNPENKMIKFFKPKHNRCSKNSKVKVDKKFMNDFMKSIWYAYRDKSAVDFCIDGIKFKYLAILRTAAEAYKSDFQRMYCAFQNDGLHMMLKKEFDEESSYTPVKFFDYLN